MASKASSNNETISEINVVPLVDIILVVLIIFMVTAPALIKPSVAIDLPEASSGDETTPSLLNVAITADGTVMINNQEVNQEEAKNLARIEVERNPSVEAVIVADRELDYGVVVRVLDWIKSTGVNRFAVTTDKPLTE
ncbi:MAG: biopolymer transporter ExbD [Bdellovibrionales bacterium]|nr:biopolymer transporter ExbD [Bdellovibrionales bacterium]